MQLFHYFFDWYHGQVWPNLVASILTTALVWIIGLKKLVKLHREHEERIHNHITQAFANVTEKSED